MNIPRWLGRQFLSRQFLQFVAIGAIAAGLNWGSGRLFSLAFGFSVSISLAYLVGMASAFVMNRIWVFPRANRPILHQAGYFVAVNLVSFPVVWSVAIVLGEYVLPALGMTRGNEGLAHAFALAAPMFLAFLFHKFLTFAHRSSQMEGPHE